MPPSIPGHLSFLGHPAWLTDPTLLSPGSLHGGTRQVWQKWKGSALEPQCRFTNGLGQVLFQSDSPSSLPHVLFTTRNSVIDGEATPVVSTG